MNFEIIPVASEFSDSEEQINFIIGKYIQVLEKSGGRKLSQANSLGKLPVFYFAVTGGVENKIVEMYRNSAAAQANEPVFIIAHPANNSLPASLEILAKLQQDNIKGEIFYLSSPDDNKTLLNIENAAKDLGVLRYLRSIRLGAIGEPSDWLIASMPSAETVKSKWGPEVIPVPIGEVLSDIDNTDEDEVHKYADELYSKSSKTIEPSIEEIFESVKIFFAVKRTIKKYKLDSITVRCFDIVLNAKTTGCYALSQLNDDGIIAGCEGDLMSIIGMLWGNTLLREIPWIANPSKIDTDTNKIWLAHCTVPRKLASKYKLRSHFESGIGVGIQGKIPEGPVTILRIGGKKMDKIWISEGTILQNGHEYNMCRTQVEIKLERGGEAADLLKNPLGNHMVLFMGHHMDRLYSWHRTMVD